MAKVKISEFSSTPGNNTDIDGINLAEGCAPSGINDAIRELMAQLKDFQTGAVGDSFNGPVGTTTAAAGAFTTLTTSSTVTHNGGTANGVAYLNGSKVLTTGSALVFDGSNLGLGVTPSAWGSIFDAFEGAFGGCIAFQNNGPSTKIGNNWYYDGSNYVYKTTNAAARYDLSDSHKWYTAPSGTAGNAISFSQVMTLDASGNLSIGDTNAFGFRLHTNAGASVSGHLVSSTTTGVYTNWSDSSATNSPQVGGIGDSLVFRTNSSERARIDSSGNLLVGKTSATTSSKLEVDALSNVAQFWHTDSSDTIGIYMRHGRGLSGFSGKMISFRRNDNTEVGSIVIGDSSTSYNTSSDYRLKEDIQPMTGALAQVSLLKPVTYKWKSSGEADQGFIAHELAEVCPAAVTGEKDDVDEDGNPKYQGIDTSFLVVTLTAAIQEQQAIIESLKARLDAANL